MDWVNSKMEWTKFEDEGEKPATDCWHILYSSSMFEEAWVTNNSITWRIMLL